MNTTSILLATASLIVSLLHWTDGQKFGGPEALHHPEFFSLENRDYPYHNSTKLEGIKSPYKCAQQVIEHGHSLAAYKKKAQTCQLKKVRWNRGQSFNAFDRPLGRFDVPLYDIERTRDKKTRKAWLKDQECDVIHMSSDGQLQCKLYETSPGTVLLFRYYHPSA